MSLSLSAAAPAGPNLDLRRPARIAGIGVLLLVVSLGLWAGLTVISGAVIATGQVALAGKPRVIQSLDGGTVEQLAVTEGQTVEAGALLARLDPTLLQINLDMAQGRLAAALARRARLQAEQAGWATLAFVYPTLPFILPETGLHEEGERRIFAARAATLAGGRDQLTEALAQLDNQIAGVTGQIEANGRQIALIDRDLANMSDLIAQGLARQSQLSELEQRRAALAGEQAALQAELARLSNSRRDQELATLQQERTFMEGVVTELREVTAEVEELILEIVTRQSQLDRVEIRAPVAGVVHDLKIAAEGEVLPPGGTLARIVPIAEDLSFEIVVDPRAIEDVYPGQAAQVVIASRNPQSAPRLDARVTTISADVIEDERTGESFYRATLKLAPGALDTAGLGQRDLVQGMPVEVFLQTGSRSVLAYLVHPVTTHLRRTFRE